MTRTGKIARLGRDLRDQLNSRLADGEQGKHLVEWLNGHPEVLEVLELYFDGRPVTESNLSDWKQGGYEDWVRHQENLEWARLAVDEAEELEEEGGGVPLSDRVSPQGTIALGRMIRAAQAKPPETPRERRELLETVRELTAVRVADHRAARLKMDTARWREELAEIRKKEQHRKLWVPIRYLNDVQNRETYIRMHTAQMTPGQAKEFRNLVNMDLYGVFGAMPLNGTRGPENPG